MWITIISYLDCSPVFHDFGTNCMVPSDWDSAPRCIFGPNFISDLIGESSNFSATRDGGAVIR